MSTAAQGNLLMDINLAVSKEERERSDRERAAKTAANTAAGAPTETTDYSLVFYKPSRRMVRSPLDRGVAESDLRVMRERCETLAAQLATATAELAASDAARDHAPIVDPRVVDAIAEAEQRLTVARRYDIRRGVDHRAVAEAESALADLMRVADLMRAEQASPTPAVSRTELLRHRRDCDRLLTYWSGRIRRLESRLAREAAEADAARAWIEARSAERGARAVVQRGVDRARAIVGGAA